MKAPTYADALYSATARPAKKSTPAVWRLAVMLSIGPRNVSAALDGPEIADDVVQRVGGPVGVAEQPDDRHQGDERREQGQHAVVGERRRPVREVVVAELPDGPLQDLEVQASSPAAIPRYAA